MMKEFKAIDEIKKEYIIFNGKKNQYIYLSQFYDKKKQLEMLIFGNLFSLFLVSLKNI